MPSYKVHLLGGFASYVIASIILNSTMPQTISSPLQQIVLLSFALLGSIFPDIDIGSKMRRFFLLSLITTIPIALLHNKSSFIALAAFYIFCLVIRHRSITHAIWFIVAFPSALSFVLISHNPSHTHFIIGCCFSFVIGALSHRLLDLGFKRFFNFSK